MIDHVVKGGGHHGESAILIGTPTQGSLSGDLIANAREGAREDAMKDVGSILIVVVVTVALASRADAASLWSQPTNVGTNAAFHCGAANVGGAALGSVTVRSVCNNGSATAPQVCAPLNPQATCDGPTAGPSDGQLECWCEVTVTGGSTTSVRAAMQLSPLPVTPDGLPKLVVPATAESTSSSACCGDCNGDGIVTINEIITTVNFALNECPATQ